MVMLLKMMLFMMLMMLVLVIFFQAEDGIRDPLVTGVLTCALPILVDTGVSTYEPCAERRYERSTAAHNTVRIDGEDQAEIWASFRVGRRPRVGRIDAGETAGMCFVRGGHYAYQHRGVTHSRMIVLTPRNSWVVIDSLSGKGKHLVESFIHFHPAVRVENVNNPARSAVGTASERWAMQFGEY